MNYKYDGICDECYMRVYVRGFYLIWYVVRDVFFRKRFLIWVVRGE